MITEELKINQIQTGTHKGSFIFESDLGVLKLIEEFPGGVYSLQDIGGPNEIKTLYKPVIQAESYIDLTGGTVKKVLKRASKFFSKEVIQKYEELSMAHKTGFILYGPPGTGKTVTSYIIMKKLSVEYNAICIVLSKNTTPSVWRRAITELIGYKRPIVFFCDECEEILRIQEVHWLTFLDGHESITNFMFIGCTNYINEISSRIKRPSRIEHLIEVKSIEEEVAIEYVRSKVGKLPANTQAALVHYAIDSGATIDAFKNAIKEFYIYSNTSKPELFEDILKSYIRNEIQENKEED